MTESSEKTLFVSGSKQEADQLDGVRRRRLLTQNGRRATMTRPPPQSWMLGLHQAPGHHHGDGLAVEAHRVVLEHVQTRRPPGASIALVAC
jgi:hypothetical protein